MQDGAAQCGTPGYNSTLGYRVVHHVLKYLECIDGLVLLRENKMK